MHTFNRMASYCHKSRVAFIGIITQCSRPLGTLGLKAHIRLSFSFLSLKEPLEPKIRVCCLIACVYEQYFNRFSIKLTHGDYCCTVI